MFDQAQVIFLIATGIILFLYGLDHFSREIESVGRERFHGKLERFASNRWRGFALGALFTAAVQSSSAASALAVSLVHSGLISFRNSLAILFGANVGTTVTAQIVALKLTGMGPLFITLGFLISLFAKNFRPLGRVVFYFGFIFFSLDLISAALAPLRTNGQILELLAENHSPLVSIGIGALVTFVLQSSSVSTGLIVLLVQQGALHLDTACFMVLGSNIGTTGTAIIASLPMSAEARRAAHGNTLFNLAGVLFFLPFLMPLQSWLLTQVDGAAAVVALIHLVFNCSASLVFLIFLRPFEWLSLRFSRLLGC